MTRTTNILRNSTAALSLAAAAFAATPALAEKAELNSMSINAGTASGAIHVISTDKNRWNAIKPGVVQFEPSLSINTKHPGYVDDIAVVLGSCDGTDCSGAKTLWSDSIVERDYSGSPAVGLPTSKIGVSGTGITLGDQIIARCNEQLQADGPTKSHGFMFEVPVAFITDTGIRWLGMDNVPDEANLDPWPHWPAQVDHTRNGTLDVQIVCDAVVKPATNDLSFDHGEFDVENVRVFATTYQNAVPGSNAGTVCPALKVTTRAETNKAGPVQMRLWRQKDDGPITDKLIDAWSTYDAQENRYFARYHEFIDVGSTSWYQFKVEVTSEGAWGPQDGWNDITVHCTSPGGGGLTTAPQDDDRFPTPQAKWTGDLTIADSASAGGDKSCPRSGQVFFEVTRPEHGNFDYRIQCSNGAYFEGTATGYDQGAGVFEAYGAHNISINRTRDIQCTLQEMTPAPVTVAVKKEGFTCANPTFPPATDDIVSDTRPTEQEPVKPVIVIDPVKTIPPVSILCRKGFELKGSTCVRTPVIVEACDEGEVRGKNGKCVKKPGVSIFCLPGFEQVGKTCVKRPVIVQACEKGQHRVKGTCVDKPTVSIFCKKGFKPVGKSCVRIPTVADPLPKTKVLKFKAETIEKKPARKTVKQTIVKTKPVLKTLKLPVLKKAAPARKKQARRAN